MNHGFFRRIAVALLALLLAASAAKAAGTTPEGEAHVFHILEETQEEAARSKSFIVLLAQGNQQRYLEEFKKRARTVSRDTGSAPNGGDLSFGKPGQYVPEFAAAVRTAPLGEIVGPVKTAFGWHLLMVTEWRDQAASAPRSPPEHWKDLIRERQIAVVRSLASEWIYTGSGSDKAMLFRNKALKEKAGGMKSAWVLRSHPQPQAEGGKPYQSTKELWWFKCSDETLATTDYVSYVGDDGSGEVVRSWSQKFDATELRDVVPGSVGEMVLRTVCRKR